MKFIPVALAALLVAPIGTLASPTSNEAKVAKVNNIDKVDKVDKVDNAEAKAGGYWADCSSEFSCQNDDECRMSYDCWSKAVDHLDKNIYCDPRYLYNQCIVFTNGGS
ncbi:hypothetical protein EMCG_09446 [[Emmonsia] crescens]|uniref:Uncharacterized protein n=1 Tax=[Emmonsia] crescens TaxID=73230 RepID=A0A0G2I2M9_9EURO|nr:hypothetical protein EMCG_09446 [Emmonsia crescens UAMH 3008]